MLLRPAGVFFLRVPSRPVWAITELFVAHPFCLSGKGGDFVSRIAPIYLRTRSDKNPQPLPPF
jgi:hypothetical protein